ncbi:arylsulfatase [Paludisphaera sp.]|uniref:arylsulfatase n=1 Tax=Paludisphaera sp. TaxID=2017432 RepID=UPI00301D2ACB
MRFITSTLLAWTLAAVAVAAEEGRAPLPNVVLILADDMGFSDLGCYGGEIETPNLDRLAANGLRYAQFYNTARCWPSRAAIMTGYYAQQVNRDPGRARPGWAALLPRLLAPAGYRSYHSGKWHIDGPVLAAGFERSYALEDHDRNFNPRAHRIDDRPLPPVEPGEGYYTTNAIADRAVEWLAEHDAKHKGEPFLLYLAFTAPHFPLQAPAEDIEKYRSKYAVGWDAIRESRRDRLRELGLIDAPLPDREPGTIPSWSLTEEELKRRIGPGEVGHAVAWDSLTPEEKEFQATKMAIHAAMVDRMDREIGKVLARLEASGAIDDTLILFASDNGASAEQIIRGDGHDPAAAPGSAATFLCLGPGWSTASNTPFRLHKAWNHEGGVATPLIAHWPAGIRARGEIRRAVGHLVDVVPTVLELAGLAPPTSIDDQPRPPLPGASLAPTFAADVPIDREAIYFRHEKNRGLRRGDWKIVAAGEGSPWELYDLAADRSETRDLAAEHPEKVRELADLWSRLDAEYRQQGASGGE